MPRNARSSSPSSAFPSSPMKGGQPLELLLGPFSTLRSAWAVVRKMIRETLAEVWIANCLCWRKRLPLDHWKHLPGAVEESIGRSSEHQRLFKAQRHQHR